MIVETKTPARHPGRARLLALALGTIAGAGVGWIVWTELRRERAPVEVRFVPPIEPAKLAARRREALDPLVVFAPEYRRLELTREIAAQLAPLWFRDQEYDPQCFLRHKENLRRVMPWKEHPKGEWHMNTNALGLREDREISESFAGLRILCAGDSHTDGVCDNAESWPHRLEAHLTERFPGKAIEVVNAGKGMTGFYNYRGVLERLAYLHPALFVVGVYGGNDFMESLRVWYYFAGAEKQRFDKPDWARLDAAKRSDSTGLAQCWTSVYYFRRFPGEVDAALTAALALSADMAGAAGARGIRILFVYIPARAEVLPQQELERSRQTLATLGLDQRDLETTRILADRYLQGLAALGIASVDLREPFRSAHAKLYWDEDQHINITANDLIGATLVPWAEPLAAALR